MHVVPECFPCLMRQTLNTLKNAHADERQQTEALREVAAHLVAADLGQSPASFSEPIYRIVSRVTGVADPFAALKRETNALALKLRPEVQQCISASRDPLRKALHAAAAGNVIDAGIAHDPIDVQEDIRDLLHEPFAIDDLAVFKNRLKRGHRLLYLADNAGEIVFDALAIERIQRFGVMVTVAVKSHPIINDATLEDAKAAGLSERCPVMETGSGNIGVKWSETAPALREAFDAADLVLAKGHGHLETLWRERHPGLFFLLKAKCAAVASALNCPLGCLAFAHADRLRRTVDESPRGG